MTHQPSQQDFDAIPLELYQKARALAARGWGWEDIWVELRGEGMTGKAAWVIVFGKTGVHSK